MAGPENDPHDFDDFANQGWSKNDSGNWSRTPVKGIGFEVRDYGAFGRPVYVAVYHSRGKPIPVKLLFSTLQAAKEVLWRCYESIK
jgi:hypothetical protein